MDSPRSRTRPASSQMTHATDTPANRGTMHCLCVPCYIKQSSHNRRGLTQSLSWKVGGTCRVETHTIVVYHLEVAPSSCPRGRKEEAFPRTVGNLPGGDRASLIYRWQTSFQRRTHTRFVRSRCPRARRHVGEHPRARRRVGEHPHAGRSCVRRQPPARHVGGRSITLDGG